MNNKHHYFDKKDLQYLVVVVLFGVLAFVGGACGGNCSGCTWMPFSCGESAPQNIQVAVFPLIETLFSFH